MSATRPNLSISTPIRPQTVFCRAGSIKIA
jgi:hypothetical protein